MNTEQVREMLKKRIGDSSMTEVVMDIAQTIHPGKKEMVETSTLYAYLNGYRNITGRGVKILARYFYAKGDLEMVDALCQLALGIPYPRQGNGKG